MTFDQAKAYCDKLYIQGTVAVPTIAVFGKTDDRHVYSVGHVAYFTPNQGSPIQTRAEVARDLGWDIDEITY